MSAFRAWVDFNDVDSEGCVTTLRRFASHHLEVGDFVRAWDHDGTNRDGIVVSLTDSLATIRLTAPEWWTREDARLAREEGGGA